MTSRPGLFFFVVGPSGVGKDTLIEGARAALGPSGAYVFARRVITRPADAGGEAHEAATEAEFAARERAGGFLATWRAHGLRYGLPATLCDDIATGRHVVANGSRAVVAELAPHLPRFAVVSITAARGVRAGRIAARGRESGAAVAARLEREVVALAPPGISVLEVANDGSIADGVARFVAALSAAAEG
jgi:thymidine phosphorylase